MKRFFVVLCVVMFSIISMANAQSEEGVASFQPKKDSWKRSSNAFDENAKSHMLKIANRIGEDALRVIIESEKVSCFTVSNKKPDFDGQVIDGYSLDGFCGVIDGKNLDLIRYLLIGKTDAILFDKKEQCVVSPKLMFRFSRGFDNVDVMWSAPCYSTAFYYSGRERFFNLKPISEDIEKLVKFYSQSAIDIDDILSGKAQEILEDRKKPQSTGIKKSWGNKTENTEADGKASKGWGKWE